MNYPEYVVDASRRMEFVLLFDVTDGNPNGDPDAGNMPRVDPETMQGLVTDACIKRKVRDYVQAVAGGDPGMEIYIKHHVVRNDQHRRAYAAEGKEPTNNPDSETLASVRSRMCSTFFDVRFFGGVLNLLVNCGQVRGPMQMVFARSIDPIAPIDVAMSQVSRAKKDDSEGLGPRKGIVPYGLYRSHGFFSPMLAEDTGADGEDLEIFWDALQKMWEMDRSAARGMMCCRGLHIFSHQSPYGNAPTQDLFDRVKVQNVASGPTRKFTDYEVTVDTDGLPDTVRYYGV